MQTMKYRIRRATLAIGLAATLALAAVMPALASSGTGTANVTGGTLSETTTVAPTVSVTLNGTDQVPTYTLAVGASDNTGTGAGWNLTITSTQFSTGGATPKTLATTASSVTGATSASNGTGTYTAPTNGITYPLTVPAGTTAPAAVKFFNAAAGTGLGSFTITPTVGVSIPANAYAGTYTSTITLSIVSGP